jgi:Protein of unknown function (DUF1499)
MIALSQPTIAPLARWSSRLALFSASVVLTAAALHRLASFPTPATLNLFMLGLAGAGLGVLVGVVALVQIWRRGYAGTWTATGGLVLGLTLLAFPLAYLPAALTLPAINDITTDWADPPRFVALAKGRGEDSNGPAYPGEQFALAQQQAYPDLRTFTIDRPANEVFELVVDAVRGRRGLGWKVASEEPPNLKTSKPGVVEASERTMILGFTDDVVVRVMGAGGGTRVDARSASRYGQHDFGQNATRIRRLFRELQARLEATAPGVDRPGLRTSRAGAIMPKRPLARDLSKGASRSARIRALSDAQRARVQKEKPH